MTDSTRSPWNSLEIAKLVVGSLTPIALAVFGLFVNSSFRAADEAHAETIRKAEAVQRQVDASKTLAQTRQAAVGGLSKYIYERRVRGEMLLSGLRRHANAPTVESRNEVFERKRQYDDAYVNWNTNHQANLLLIRQVLGSNTYSDFEGLLEFRLVSQVFAPLDKCLTEAYDAAARGQDPRPILKACRATEMVQRSLDCGYAITDELFRLSSPTGNPQESKSVVESRCPAE
jgi:hypothetical protein